MKSLSILAVVVMLIMLPLRASAFDFGFNGLPLNVISIGEIKKCFHRSFRGVIKQVKLVNDQGNRFYRLYVSEKEGVNWIYHYNALTGELVSKKRFYG